MYMYFQIKGLYLMFEGSILFFISSTASESDLNSNVLRSFSAKDLTKPSSKSRVKKQPGHITCTTVLKIKQVKSKPSQRMSL